MADNKIQISVEVLNNTKTSINQIMTDLTNMNASIQASTAATNQLITQSMQKSAATIQAANQTASASASGSYQTMQLNAKTTSEGISKSFKKAAEDVRKSTIQAAKDSGKSADEMVSIINKAYRQYSRTIKEGTDALHNDTKAVKDNIRSKEQHTEATKRQNGAMEQLAKRFISIAAAIYLVRKAYMEATASVKAYEEAAIAQGKLSKGSAAGPQLAQSFKQLQVEAGSVIEPYAKALADYMKTNTSEVEAQVRRATDVMINVVKLAVGMIQQVANVIYMIMDGVMIGITALINGVMNLINNTVMKLPGIPKGAKEGFQAAVKETDLWVKTYVNLAETHAKDLTDSSYKVNEAMTGLLTAFAGGQKASGVKAVIKDPNAEKRKQQLEADMKWLNDLRIKASETSVNAEEAAQLKLDNEYIANKENIYNMEKKWNLDLTAFKVANEKIYNIETQKLANERAEREKKELERRREELKAALSAASLAGLINTVIPSMSPGKGSLIDITGSKAAFKKSYEGNEALRKRLEEDLKLYDQLNNAIGDNEVKLAELRKNITTDTNNYIMQVEYDTTQARIDSISQTVNAYAEAGNMIAEIANNVYQVQLNNINRETEERQKALDKAYAGASKYVKNKGKLDQQQKEANEKLQEEQAAKTKEIQEKQKNAAIAQALIAGATATMNAWSSSMQMGMPAGLIMGIAMSALITALTVAQVAVIESQKFAQGGIVQGPATGDQVPIQANGGEMVLTTSQQASLWNMIATRSGSTNTASASINMGGDTYIVSGSLDKTAVSEIRRMKEERQAQLRADIKELSYRNQLQLAR